MKKIRLGDIATLITKGTTPTTIGFSFVDTGVNFVKIESIGENGEFLPDKFARITDECDKKLRRSQLEENDILFSIAGAIGRTAIVPSSILPANTNQALAIIRIPQNAINLRFVLYALQSQAVEEQSEKQKQGVAQLNLSLKNIADILIPLVSSEKQDEIVRNLAAIDAAIALRKEQIRLIDQLVKSRFVEMFIGKNYSRKTVDEVSLDKGEYGAQSASVEYTSDRPRYVRITDINDDGTLNNDMVSSINHSDDDQYRLRYGDFLFARMGATVGKTYAFRKGNQIYAGYLIRYKLDLTQIHPLYLFWYTRLNEYWDWVKLNQSGAAQPGINAKKFGSLRIPVPPIDIQNRFAAFVAEVDKSKFRIQKSLSTSRKLWTMAQIDAIMNMDFSTQRSL